MLPLTLTLTTPIIIPDPTPIPDLDPDQVFHMLTEKAWGATYPEQVRL